RPGDQRRHELDRHRLHRRGHGAGWLAPVRLGVARAAGRQGLNGQVHETGEAGIFCLVAHRPRAVMLPAVRLALLCITALAPLAALAKVEVEAQQGVLAVKISEEIAPGDYERL